MPKGWDRWFAFGEIDCEWAGLALALLQGCVHGQHLAGKAWSELNCGWWWVGRPIICSAPRFPTLYLTIVFLQQTTATPTEALLRSRPCLFPLSVASPPCVAADYNYTISDQGANKQYGTEPEDYSTGEWWFAAFRMCRTADHNNGSGSCRGGVPWHPPLEATRCIGWRWQCGCFGAANHSLMAAVCHHMFADVLTAEAVKFIQQARDDDRPFFLYLAPCEHHLHRMCMCPSMCPSVLPPCFWWTACLAKAALALCAWLWHSMQASLPTPAADACHRPHIPAPRHIGKYKGLRIPRVPSWNESATHIRQKVRLLSFCRKVQLAAGRC